MSKNERTLTNLNNDDGFMVMFLVSMIAFIGALAWGFGGTAKLYIDDVYSIKQIRGRAFSLSQIQNMLSTTKSLSESARFLPENSQLRVCLEGGPEGACTENCCQGGLSQGFYFKDPLDTSAQIETKRNISAPPGNPVYYKLDGSLCQTTLGTNISGCAYSLTSTFSAHCPGDSANCDHAEHLKIAINIVTLANHQQIKERQIDSYYFPKVNYQPVLPPLGDQFLTVLVPLTLPFTIDPGHPSEGLGFKFEQCQSANEAIVKVTCQAFAGGVGQITLEPLAVGNADISLQINDGGFTNYLSKTYTFNTVVSP